MMANPIVRSALLSILLVIRHAACEENPRLQKIDTLKSMDELDNSEKLKPGYTISIRIVEDKRAALQQYVATTGQIQASYVGLVKAEGLTCRELAFKIKPEIAKIDKISFGDYIRTSKLSDKFFEDPTVLVTLDAAGDIQTHLVCPDAPSVVVLGSMAKQGTFDFASIPSHKLSGLLDLAGGVADKSVAPKIRVIRKTSGQ